jgi:hypothetical protein
LPSAGIELTVADPWGNITSLTSGSKPQYGEGGFEVLAPHATTYTLRFLDKSFEVQAQDGTTFVTFTEIEPPPEPEEPAPESLDEEDLLDKALEQLDRIIYALRLQRFGNIGSAAMKVDGTIILTLQAEGPDGEETYADMSYPPEDPRRLEILSHLGGLQPGESKPVPPWPDDLDD